MNTCMAWLGLLVAATNLAAVDGLRLLPDEAPQQVWGGGVRSMTIRLHNAGTVAVETDIQVRLLQTTTSTAVLTREAPWKALKVLPGQTVLETATLDIPDVRAETRFAVQWLDETGRALGVTSLLVYPTNLLQELTAMLGEDGTLGLFDPDNVSKPLLTNLGVECENLEDSGVAAFRGRLAVLGPFASRAQVPDDFAHRVEAMADKGVAAVWMQPPPEPRDKLQPSFEIVTVGTGTVVLAQADLVADLAASPESQLNLLELCRRALRPAPRRLPGLNP
jgi:hypothetical protein